jgi:tetratricopeptide (TPR) repeat protein
VQQGQTYYEQSRFDEAITLLKDLVDRGLLSGEELQKARELLARSYVKKGYPVQAKEMFKAILREDPAWRPDPIRVPPDETAVFEQALKEYQEEKSAAVPPPGTTAPATGGAAATTPAPVSAGQIGLESSKKPLMKQWWVWALGAVAIGGIAVAAGGGGGDDGGTPAPASLANFPPTP